MVYLKAKSFWRKTKSFLLLNTKVIYPGPVNWFKTDKFRHKPSFFIQMLQQFIATPSVA